jgi:hypothetical protein
MDAKFDGLPQPHNRRLVAGSFRPGLEAPSAFFREEKS